MKAHRKCDRELLLQLQPHFSSINADSMLISGAPCWFILFTLGIVVVVVVV